MTDRITAADLDNIELLSPERCVEVVAALDARMSTLLRNWTAAKRRAEQYVRDTGPYSYNGSVVECYPDGYNWDEAKVAEECPEMCVGMTATLGFTSPADCDRALSLVSEEVPGSEVVSVVPRIDKRMALRAISSGGELGKRLEQLRTGRLRLRVTTR